MKRPICHKLLYRLSKDQRKQFFGEGFILNNAVVMQDNINKALDNMFFYCPTCNNHISGTVTDQVTTDNMTRSCIFCGEEVALYFIEFVSPQEIQEVVLNSYGLEKKHLIEHVHDILAELRAIPEDLSVTMDGRYFTELVSGLLHELKCILDDIIEELTCQFERFEIINFKSPIQDIRRRIKTRSSVPFKNLPDFSGCEEEAGVNSMCVKPISSTSTIEKVCITIQHFYLPLLIPLSNLRMTG